MSYARIISGSIPPRWRRGDALEEPLDRRWLKVGEPDRHYVARVLESLTAHDPRGDPKAALALLRRTKVVIGFAFAEAACEHG